MPNKSRTSKMKFIFGWVLNNFYAWVVFEFIINFAYTFLGPGPSQASVFLAGFMGIPFGNPNVPISFFYTVVIGLLFGISLGSLQWVWLKSKGWQIPALGWILSTTLGWGFSTLLSSLLSINYEISYFVAFLSVGIMIGVFQTFVWHKSVYKSIPWILANAFGVFIWGLFVYSIISIGFAYKPIFRNILYSLYTYFDYYLHIQIDIYDFPPLLVYGFFILPIILPSIGAITTSLPTGFLLYNEFYSKNADMIDLVLE